MYEDDEETVQENILCCEASCHNDAIYRCTPDSDYPVSDGEILEVFACQDHVGTIGLSYPVDWPGPPNGWRVEFLDVVLADPPN